MSRIQRILDKAEREGVLYRTRPMVNPAAPGRHGATALEELEEPRAPAEAAPVEAPPARLATPFPAARAIRSTVLAPYLVAATQGTGIAAERYRALAFHASCRLATAAQHTPCSLPAPDAARARASLSRISPWRWGRIISATSASWTQIFGPRSSIDCSAWTKLPDCPMCSWAVRRSKRRWSRSRTLG